MRTTFRATFFLIGENAAFFPGAVQDNDMTDDYIASESPEAIAKAVIRKASPGGIITLHDGKNVGHGVDRSNTIRALPRIIAALRQQGYTFVTVPELLGIPPYAESGLRGARVAGR